MDDLSFWAIVQRAHDQSGGDMDEKCEAIKNEIAKLPKEEAEAFSHLFDAMMDKAYAWPLWGAAYVIHGGCGDDTFSDFRASLISRGRRAFEMALSDPDALADEVFDENEWFYEGYQYAVSEGVEAAAAIAQAALQLADGRRRGEEVPPADRRRIVDVVRHINAHFAEPCTLDSLAAIAGMSRFHFEIGRAHV